MALVGGGGAPNVAGSNPAGTGQSLNYVGNHVYAYSGVVGAASGGTTYLNFTTGSEYIVGQMICNYADNQTTDMTYTIKFDSQIIQQWVSLGPSPYDPQNVVDLVIPPFTKVEVIITSASTTRDQTVGFTGRIH